MKKTLIATSVFILTFVGVIASIASQHQDFINQVFAISIPCESGTLSYDEAKDAMTNGELLISLSPPDLSANAVAVNVTNNTQCSLPTSIASYKMFGPYSLSTQSQQEFFAGTPVMNIAAGATGSLSINIPACAAQYDLWFGAAPRTLVDNQPYGTILTGDQVRSDNLCVQPVSTITVIKLVLNQNGHTKTASDFTFHVKKAGIDVAGSPAPAVVDPGTTYTLSPGSYVLSEDADASYTSAFSGNCDAVGNMTLTAGNHLICTIINTDIPAPVITPPPVTPPPVTPPPVTPPPAVTPPPVVQATLHIIKHVINDNGGAAVPTAFNLRVKKSGVDIAGSPAGGVESPGTSYTVGAGTYVVSEDAWTSFAGTYTSSFSGNCDANGNITIVDSTDKTCIITNNDVAPEVTATVEDEAVITGPPLAPMSTPAISTPAPIVAAVPIAPVVPVVPTAPVIPIVTDTAPVILAVVTPAVSNNGGGGPLINLTKVPSPTELPNGPGLVTYTYTVVNENNQFDLIDISVVDDKCGPSMFISGDRNNNGKLDPREQWIYHCTTRLMETTTNTAVAIGYSDNPAHQPATATAVATVIVGLPTATLVKTAALINSIPLYSPDFPNTGFAPDCSNKISKCVSQ